MKLKSQRRFSINSSRYFRSIFSGDLLTKILSGRGVIKAGERTSRAGYGFKYFDSPTIKKL